MYSSSSMALQLRPKCRSISTPTFVQFFSSSSSSSDPYGTNSTENNTATSPPPPQPPPPPPPSSSESKPSYSSHFSDVKSSLKQQQQQQQPKPTWQQPRRPSLSRESPPSRIASLEEIRKNLHEYRRRVAAPSSAETNRGTSPQPISFQELYKRNLNEKPQQSPVEAAPGKSGPGSGKFSFEAIRESLRHMRNTSGNVDQKGSDSMPLSALRNSLKLGSVDQNKGSWSSRIGGESEKLPASIFGKEMRQRNEGARPVSTAMKTEFVKIYSYKELGEKLRQLRPEGKVEEKNWFSLGELNERLVKLRENEENETKSSNISGVSFNDLRDSLLTLKMSDDEKAKRSTIQRLDVLSHFGSTPSFMLDPPKEQLVEKFFHPDNMSSAEKMKIELQKVRDEFKMSESDCGSARVQVAQLTTKIKHLSTALHKKDKHSRKGLQEMVQKRKKLLKYLRRTDWDSYCFVLSRLGLRDNPGYKAT